MALVNGTQLGPYAILSLLGTGSMGEVYCARDSRLDREVAVKVLPAELVLDPDRLRRFEQEAKAVALLNHPNVLQIYDTGLHEGSPYLVMELLQGVTLRERIAAGPLPQKKALDFAHQIALGLAAAHAKGIVHRDLKPENCFVMDGDRIKVLDFGLAKFSNALPSDAEITAPNRPKTLETQVGMLVGTAGYMSPEQISSGVADPRSDIFALGVILWEMLSGERPFRGPTVVELLHAILKEEPKPLPVSLGVPYSLQRILDRCLEKKPSARYQSTLDLAFALDGQRMSSLSGAWPLKVPRFLRPGGVRPKILAAASSLMVLGGAFMIGKNGAEPEIPYVSRLTFHNARLGNARLIPGGEGYVFGMAQNDGKMKLYSGKLRTTGAKALEISEEADILSISSRGEMALLLPDKLLALAQLPAGNEGKVTPRRLLEQVEAADWAPNGQELAIVKRENGLCRLEFPMGNVVYEPEPATCAGIDSIRISPDGERIAFLETAHSGKHRLWVVDKKKEKEKLAEGDIETPAWLPGGKEILCREQRQNYHFLVGISLKKEKRILYSSTEDLCIRDVSKTGTILFEQQILRRQLLVQRGEQEKDLSWQGYSQVADLCQDGSRVLFGESMERQGQKGAYFRTMDGMEAIRLGEGRPMAFSQSGKNALILCADGKRGMALVPLGAGSVKRLSCHGLRIRRAAFLNGDQQLLVNAVDKKGNHRCYKQDIETGAISEWGPLSSDGEFGFAVAPKTSWVALSPLDDKIHILRSDGQIIKALNGFSDGKPLRWSEDGQDLYVAQMESLPLKIWRINVATGVRSLWKQVLPKEMSGLRPIKHLSLSADGTTLAYSLDRFLSSDLYLMNFSKD